jgi:hypothetical protein
MAIITRSAEGARETVRQKRERDQELLVWPDLVFVEFIAALVFTLTFVALSVIIDAPLLNQANSNITPNPSKAPWYLLNLQELLLHMEAGLAGVIVPTVALIVLMAIPYVDRSNDGQGVWFGTKNAVRITVFTFVFSSFFLTVCILWDDGAHVRVYEQLPVTLHLRSDENQWTWPGKVNPFREDDPETPENPDGALSFLNPAEGVLLPMWEFVFFENRQAIRESWEWSLPVPYQPGDGEHDGRLDWPEDLERIPIPLNGTWLWEFDEPQWMPGWMQRVYFYDRHFNVPEIMAIYLMPVATILFGIALLMFILFKIGWASTVRDGMIALFTGFILTYLALTIIGAAFRGKGQELVPPTRVPNLEEFPNIMREAPPAQEFALFDVRTGQQA